MKIGILTYHCVPNFGAQLQTISTIGFLKKKGYEPIVLHWYPQDLEDMYSKRIPVEQIVEHKNFAEQNMPLSKLCRTESDLIKEIEKIGVDAVFSGSDALFKYTPKVKHVVFSKRKFRFVKRHVLSVENVEGNAFFGAFLAKISKKIKAVAFSISSQNCEYKKMDDEEKKTMNKALENYLKISARDEWTRKMIQNVTGRNDIDVTPDPVFAFNQNCYLQLPSKKEICDKYSLPEKYVLLSFWTRHLNAGYVGALAEILKKNGLTPVAFPMPERLLDFNLEKKISLPLSPLDWYSIIKYSNGYIGERMHPIVVCLHNAVPFFCFDEYGTFEKKLFGLYKTYIPSSSKTFHILTKACLSECLYSYYDKNTTLPKPIDVVQKIMEFPVLKCRMFAESNQDFYNQSMEKILKCLEK